MLSGARAIMDEVLMHDYDDEYQGETDTEDSKNCMQKKKQHCSSVENGLASIAPDTQDQSELDSRKKASLFISKRLNILTIMKRIVNPYFGDGLFGQYTMMQKN